MATAFRLRRLTHVALTTPDPRAQAAFYEEHVGLERTAEDGGGTVYLRTNADHHCLALLAGERPGVHHVAFEVGSREELAAATEALDRAGVPRAEAWGEAGQAAAAAYRDPEGHVIELIAGVEQIGQRLQPREVRPRKVGHVGIRVRDIHGLCEFYTRHLGFRVSDWIGEQLVFLRCNPDHHSLVLIHHPADTVRVHHVAYEVPGWEDFLRQADLLHRDGRSLIWGPGRHAPSDNLFLYFRDADRNTVEFMTAIAQIWDDDRHAPRLFDPTVPQTFNLWGILPPPDFFD